MSTFVLVGGAWIGAWAWQDVAQRLRAGHHTVYPLSLTGLAERVHLASPETNLETHITDVLNLFDFEDLTDVVLVGHSYAGSVITGVANRAAERLNALVYCDTGPLANGQCLLDLFPPEGQAAVRTVVAEHGAGWRLPFPGFPSIGETASIRGLGEAHQALMQRKAVAQPFATYTQPLVLRDIGTPGHQRVVIACDDARAFLPMLQQVLPGAQVLDLDTGHWPMLSQPAELAALLGDIR